LASEVADQILHYPVRRAETAQRHSLGGVSETMHPVVKAAIDLIETNIAEPPTVPDIAARLGVSQRQLERLFRRAMGCSPVQFSQLLRLQYARVLLTSTRLSIREVSAASGFNSLSYFSLVFAKCFGKKPSEYRQAWPDQEPAPSWPGTVFAFIEKSRSQAQ
jgi:AraC family carnitine catabolism transcriptional activator